MLRDSCVNGKTVGYVRWIICRQTVVGNKCKVVLDIRVNSQPVKRSKVKGNDV